MSAASRHKVPGEGCLLNRLKQRITWCGLLLTALASWCWPRGPGWRKLTLLFARMTQQTLIIDPGHGGEDGGAVSVSGKSESQINLAIALELDQLMGFTVSLL